MIDLEVTTIYIDDLQDDFFMNEEEDLYEFIDNDVVKAFYLGIKMSEWFDKLEKDQKYLYSKQVRHIPEEISDYLKQIKYWANKYNSSAKSEQVDYVKFSEYVLNNMIIEDEKILIKIAFTLGTSINNKKDE